ncbi:aminotransferase class I/II-fold pyridoxal phosphate-dependent enzyme [Bosea sp. TAF32]|uniref:aminotransferase class I/II-fold pyridoxal phosphate-dependent enzyme n=1 Tax=Bosea sp. TAF32 TaxID=3237482 RepID=UPI003F920063
MTQYMSRDVRSSSIPDHIDGSRTNLISRWSALGRWFVERGDVGLDPYQKVSSGRIGPEVKGFLRDGVLFAGVNFASQDYLSLASHPSIVRSAAEAIDRFGVHSAGSAALMGNTTLSVALEERLARFLGYEICTLFPIGWAAGYGIIKTLVRETDHVVIDVLAHACLQEGARAATANVSRFPHLSTDAVEKRLKRIRDSDPRAGILVVTETLFSMDSDIPDIAALQALCRRYDATLLVDCAHDLGALGERGLGVLHAQDMVGKVDILMGSFSKTFASPGGFVACNDLGLKFALRSSCGPSTFTNAMTPIQAAVIDAALSIIDSQEGDERRARLLANTMLLRDGLAAEGFMVMGRPSAIVPVVLGNASISRLMTKYAADEGGIVNLVEFPAVARNACRWRMQVMADHTKSHIRSMVDIALAARQSANEYERALEASECIPVGEN